MNAFIKQIREISHDNKYTKWYINIVERAISRATTKKQATKLLGYCEKHHIVPDSFFKYRKRKGQSGFLDGNPNHKDNLVYLTAKEHIFCHLFLIKMTIDKNNLMKMVCAVDKMLKRLSDEKISPRMYWFIRKRFSENHPMKFSEIFNESKKTKLNRYNDENYNNRDKAKETWIELYGVDNPNKNPEIKQKSKNTCNERYGVDNISYIQVTCPYCGKTGGYSGMQYTHFENCPQNPNFNPEEIECPHCHEKAAYNNNSFIRWHFDYCKENPNRIERYELLTCPHCGITGTKETNIHRNHFGNCSQNPNRIAQKITCPHCNMEGDKNNLAFLRFHFDHCNKNPENNVPTCPHCGFSSKSKSRMNKFHFDKCAENTANKNKVIICPHCQTKGLGKRNMMKYHFDNCKYK